MARNSTVVDLTMIDDDDDDDLFIHAQDSSMIQMELSEVESQLEDVEKQIEALQDQKESLQTRKAELLSELDQKTSPIEAKSNPSMQDYDLRKTFSWTERVEESKSSDFGIETFRPFQLETINATLSKKDVILIMPTGGGKSLCFQLPAVVVEHGITLVVSPLLSLMEDQVSSLKNRGIRATLLNANSTQSEINQIHAAMTDRYSDLRLLYVTPEKIANSKRFMNKLEKAYDVGHLARIVIDEVHCASQWGHDFRPDYKKLGILRMQFPGVPLLGLTATATEHVVKDVKEILGLGGDCLVFRASFNRTNLIYEVVPKPPGSKEAIGCVRNLIKQRFARQSGIVYCLSRRECETVAFELTKGGVKASAYHAEIHPVERTKIQALWTRGEVHVVVATIAFGMGIDKADVRFVIHHTVSKSVENFYQETGRAGRDGKTAHCILLWRCPDAYRLSPMVFNTPSGRNNLYLMLRYSLDLVTCRRCLLARHFDESFRPDQCNRSCDHCIDDLSTIAPNDEIVGKPVRLDVTKACRDVVTIANQASRTSQRMTANQLVDTWLGTGKPSHRVVSVKPPSTYTREQCEAIVLNMILDQYLEEEFHFNAYSANSYIKAGSRANSLLRSLAKALYYLPGYVYLNRARRVEGEAPLPPAVARVPSLSRPKRVVKKADIVYGDDDDDDALPASKRPFLSKSLSSVRVSRPTPTVSPAVVTSEIEITTTSSPCRLDDACREEVITSEAATTERTRCPKAPALSDNSDDDEFNLALYDTLA